MSGAVRPRRVLCLAPGERGFFGLLAVLSAAILLYPLGASPYGLTVVRDAVILGIFALSLDVLWGRAGLPSFGHAAFFGLGGYVYALSALHLDPAYGTALGLLAAVLAGIAVGLFLGVFLLRAGVRGPLFLIATVALTQIALQVALSWSEVTGADGGLIGIPPPGLRLGGLTLTLADARSQYYAVFALALVLLLSAWWACRGRYGRILAMIVDDEFRAQTLGVNTALQLTIALAASTGTAALAGALFVAMAGLMVPDLIGPLLSIEVAVWVLVGGRGTLLGPFLGTFVVWRLSQEVAAYDPRIWPLIIGAFFIAMVFLLPEGVIGVGRRLGRLLGSRQTLARRLPR